MKFFHVYDSESFQGLVKNNLINEDTGFKIQHVFSMKNEIKFNSVAKRGGFLHTLLKEGNHPFYVDRITGGLKYHPYVWDKELIEEYRNLLGQWFLGFQLHELVGNRRGDWNRLTDCMAGEEFPYDVEKIRERLLHPASASPDKIPVYRLTQGSPEEYHDRKVPMTLQEQLEDLTWIISKRQQETDNMVISCDSGQQICYLENKLGVNTFLPEVGWQIANMRIQVALNRGMALAYKKKWGTYYECWIHADQKYTQPVFNTHPFNEWHFAQSQFGDDFTSGGENAGSSRLLQRRIYFYSLMSGAQFFGEEWGLNCSYTNMNTFELSPYGLLKKEFIEFARDHKKVKARVPFAIVLPTDYFCLPLGSYRSGKIGDIHYAYCSTTVDPAKAQRFSRIHDLIKLFFKREKDKIVGNEGHTMKNTRFGDLFDIIYADCPDEAFEKYDLLIDADPDGVFALKKGDRFPVIKNESLEKTEAIVRKRTAEVMPITVDSLHWLLSEDENGRYLSVFNNEGNTRELIHGDTVDHAADATTGIHTQKDIELSILYASSDQVRLEKKGAGEYSLFVPATDLVILRY